MKKHLRVGVFVLLCGIVPSFAQDWRVQNSGTTNQLKKIYFSDSLHGWAVGVQGTLLRTTDGGTQWAILHGPDSTARYLATCFVDTLTGWVVGEWGLPLVTTDAGKSWTSENVPKSFYMRDVFFASRDTGWIVGGGTTRGTILRTCNGGNSWQVIKDSARGGGFSAVHFITSNEGWVVGYNGMDNFDSSTIYHTTDSGISWIIQPSGHIGGLDAVSFYDTQRGWASGWFGFSPWSEVIKTTDGGRNWFFSGPQPDPSNRVNEPFRTIESIGSQLVLIGCGNEMSRNIIYRSTDGGGAWRRDSVEHPHSITSIFCTDAVHCWSCGDSGRIWKYTPSPVSVHEIPAPEPDDAVISIAVSQRGKSVDVAYTLREAASITTDLYNLLGKKLLSKQTSIPGAGTISVAVDMNAYPAGMYSVLSSVGARTYVNKIVLIR